MSLTIGKVAEVVGVRIATIRFYERRGLIEQPPKPTTGFRTYPPDTVERIRFIRQAQGLGFSLREVADLLEMCADPRTDAADVRARAAAKLDDVEEKISRLQRIARALRTLITTCPGQGEVHDCAIVKALYSCTAAERMEVTGRIDKMENKCGL